MNIKRKEVLSIFVCLIFFIGCFSTSASVILQKGSTNTHVFINVFGHCDDLHIKYNKVISDGLVEIDAHDGAIVFEYDIFDDYVLFVIGFFPQGSSLEITVQSDEEGVLFPEFYFWTIGGVPASPNIPVMFFQEPFYGEDGHFRNDKFVEKPIDFVEVWVTRAQNIAGGKNGVGVVLTEVEGGTIVTFYGKVEDIYEKAYFGYFIDPPGIVFDEIIELNYNVEFKGLIGVSVSVLNVGETVENLNWSIDLSGLVILGKHAEGVISSFPEDVTEVLRTGFVFGFGPSIITATIGGLSINASCFILGPLVLSINQPPL